MRIIILFNLKKRFKSVESDSKEFSAKLPEPFFISTPNINLFICWNDIGVKIREPWLLMNM